MHDHQTEVIGERVSDVEPLAREVLEPNLRLLVTSSVHDGNTAVGDLRVDFKGMDFIQLLGIIIRVIAVNLANSGELESFSLDSFDVPQLVEVHITKRNYLITPFYFPS